MNQCEVCRLLAAGASTKVGKFRHVCAPCLLRATELAMGLPAAELEQKLEEALDSMKTTPTHSETKGGDGQPPPPPSGNIQA